MSAESSMAGNSIDLLALKNEAGSTVRHKESTIVPREREFDVKYHAPDGNTHFATLVSRIKSGDDRILVGKMSSEMARGGAWLSLPPATQARIWALANLAVQVRQPPDWLLQWSQEDDSLLYGVSRVLEVHESNYFLGHPEQGGEDQAPSRLEIVETYTSSDTTMPLPTDSPSLI